ncbi:ABC transporter ATP-binding protein [Clostridium tarantellae]|uniref:ATP-binding cassette domain-containing protein n=1 Tax=Clostridium tarantellae TaxID=39493 RepID=A0A6I1MKR8_9CLOT|nr:ABC transporter ATP-binding protein [Clostridium tarantellae]MPQ43995.1 ATP-binding cassette domain-containing protein [Clostridium tarantellae]
MKIEIQDLAVNLNGKEIIQNVSLKIKKGNFVGIIGPNGSGKSTILKTLYKVLQANKGSIYINGKNINKISIKSLAKEQAVVSQFNEYNFDFKVKDIVIMGRTPHKGLFELDNEKDYEIARECLTKVDMYNYKDRIFSTLSGGEKQRVLLARAIAQQTDLLILDEPTNHLDIKYQIQILDLVKSLNITVLAALHDLNLAAMYSDKLYVVNKGKIVSEGIPEKVLTINLIREVFEVESYVHKHEITGNLNIVFIPRRK